jgi:hypothetical protein
LRQRDRGFQWLTSRVRHNHMRDAFHAWKHSIPVRLVIFLTGRMVRLDADLLRPGHD